MPRSLHDALNVSEIGNWERGSIKAHFENGSAENKGEAYHITQIYLQRMKADSQFFQNNPVQPLPQFQAGEVELEETLLGQGEFGVVFSIGAIHTIETNNATEQHPTPVESSTENDVAAMETKTVDDNFRQYPDIQSAQVGTLSVQLPLNDNSDLHPIQKSTITANSKLLEIHKHRNLTLLYESNVSKEYMSTHVFRDGQPRYAVKRLQDVLTGEKLLQATADLAAEANFLMSLRHPNICKMRGTIGEPGTKDFAIVMDRLIMTLREKMGEWQEEYDKGSSLGSKMKQVFQYLNKPSAREEVQSIKRNIYEEKLIAVYDVARALRHLAENRIIFRDLKPENVGVDVRGDLRLFDFGLAKELKEKDMTVPGMYSLTCMTGSRRYMAPEVIQCKDYGSSADVYSFAILAWEVMSNRDAYSGLTHKEHFITVVQKKKRPNLKKMNVTKKWNPQQSQIHTLVNKCWSHDPLNRPSMDKVCEVLFAEVLCNDDDGKAVDRSNRLALSSVHSRAGSPLWG